MRSRIVLVAGLSWIAMAAAPGAHLDENSLYRQLRGQGPAGCGPLPAPTLEDGLDRAHQEAAIAAIPGLRVPLSELLRPSSVAPVVLSMDRPRVAGDGLRVRALDLWFVARGDLDKLVEGDQAVDLFPRDLESHTELDGGQLARRGIPQPGPRAAFSHGSFTVLERVKVRTTMTTEWSKTADSAVVAGSIDRRFAGDSEFPNDWRPILTAAGGQDRLGPPAPYSVLAFYQKATRLREPAGAWLIEFHALFEHPPDWFNGRDLLTSKLPLATETGVRNFRRRLEKASRPGPDRRGSTPPGKGR